MKERFFINGGEVTAQEYEERLGNKIASVAQPIAKAFDSILGTRIATCSGCEAMKRRLNEGMSLLEATRLRLQGR